MNTELALLAIHEKTRLTLAETAKHLNISYNTARNWRAEGRFPVHMSGSPLTCSVADLAKHLDSIKEPEPEGSE